MFNHEIKKLFYRLTQLCAVVIFLSACTQYEYHVTEAEQSSEISDQLLKQRQSFDENTILDVVIELFDPGVEIEDDNSQFYSNVRESEAVWFSQLLKKALDQSHLWGQVRAVPVINVVADLQITGKIIESNADVLIVHVQAKDATNRMWIDKQYVQQASAYSYHPDVNLNKDPFQDLFNNVAEDLKTYRSSMENKSLINIRQVSKMRFAAEFSPDTYNDYVRLTENGTYALSRMVAYGDPLMRKINKIKLRNDSFMDLVDVYYRDFSENMEIPYDEWRKLTYKEVIYARQLAKKAKQEKYTGIALMLAGVAATGSSNTDLAKSGQLGVVSGSELFSKSYQTQMDSSYHIEALVELGASLEQELEPSVIDLQDRSVTLNGTVKNQFKEWKLILKKMFDASQ